MPRRRSGKKIDFVHWTPLQESFLAQAAGSAAVTAHAAQHDPETLLRFRGTMICGLDGALGPASMVQVGLGLILVPEGTGTTVLWSPSTDGDAPWIYYSQFFLTHEESVTDVLESGSPSFREIIDNKAMRIVRNQEVQLVIENVTISGSASVNLGITGRTFWGT